MKDRRMIALISLTSCLILEGCFLAKTTDNHSSMDVFRYVNESGVEVAIVGEINEHADMPDSLVLQNGESYEHTINYPALAEILYSFPYNLGEPDEDPSTDYIPMKIYYDKAICVSYTSEDKGKNPARYWEVGSYVKTKQEKRKKHQEIYKTIYTYTYTFTAEDYQDAIKAQN